MPSPTIVLIGAGSTVFTPGLLADLASSPVFDSARIRLVDVDGDAAQTMADLGRRLAGEHRSSMTLEAFVDRREALPGAELVVTTIAVGGAAGWRADLDIPARHGVLQTVGDTVGPGGVLRALRQAPELVAIGRDVADLAGSAWLANYANPLTANVRGITGWAHPKAFGLCHGTMHSSATLSRELGVPARELQTRWAGLNHLCWLLDIRRGREDLYPELRARIDDEVRTAAAGGTPGALGEPVTADLLRTFGLYPAPGDRHVAEFFSWYLRGDVDSLPQTLQRGYEDTLRYVNEKYDVWDVLRAQAAGELPLVSRPADQEAERLVAIAEALITGSALLEPAVNVPNDGKIPDLPDHAVVEIPAVIDAHGVSGVAVGPLPDGIAAVLTARVAQQELTVHAALTGSRDLAVQALCADPLVDSPATARAVLDDAVIAHRPWLDGYADPAVRVPTLDDVDAVS